MNNPFCEILASSSHVCAECYAMQKKLEIETELAPKTLHCFAGLCETAIPVRVGENVVAHRIPKTVIALGVVNLLTDLSSEMIYPPLPIVFSSVLGAGALAVGFICTGGSTAPRGCQPERIERR